MCGHDDFASTVCMQYQGVGDQMLIGCLLQNPFGDSMCPGINSTRLVASLVMATVSISHSASKPGPSC